MRPQYAEVIVDITHERLDRSFTYRIPEALAGEIGPGSCVRIPFGRQNKEIDGYVIACSDTAPLDAKRIKEIQSHKPGGVDIASRLIMLADWMRQTYGSTMIRALRTVLPVRKETKKRGTAQAVRQETQTEAKQLSNAQRAVAEGILKSFENDPQKPCLIEGVTGSGKTEVYLALAEDARKAGRQVIVLVPEIALSYQIVQRFSARFAGEVAVLHSRMSEGEKSEAFQRARSSDAGIMIGPRSALFAPFPDLGLIIIDEEQERSYRSEEAPRFDARETAIARAEIEGANVVFGSATPSVDSAYRARQGVYRHFRLDERYGDARLPGVRIVDMRRELSSGNRQAISRALSDAIGERLAAGEQSILFLNKRGYAGFVACRSCGYVCKCPHCDISLTAHRDGSLRCHYCGYVGRQLGSCPDCGSTHIGGIRAGTQQIEQQIALRFPDARILRMDADTTRKKHDYEKILAAFAAHEADILIGTQMIIKGHDFPDVTLVAALLADLSLYIADYRASEYTYQLLVQAIGRAGRGRKPGEAIIQTYHPEDESIRAAARQDYDAFYEAEIRAREIMKYPPASHLLAIRASGRDEEQLTKAMEYCAHYIRRYVREPSLSVVGPAPEQIAKVADYYRQILYLKADDAGAILRARTQLSRYIAINSGFQELRFQYDLDQ